MFNFHKDHRNLVLISALVFIGLSVLIAVQPAYKMQEVRPLISMERPTLQQSDGLRVYTAENCMACHTQQVRNIEMDKVWGERPSIPSDYYYTKERMDFWRQSPSLLGSERTGPDLTNVGKRQAGRDWHMLHLYNPRIVVKASVMPAYPWLFEERDSTEVYEGETVVAVPAQYLRTPGKIIVAKKEAEDLVSYLQSLVQPKLPGETPSEFIPMIKKKEETTTGGNSNASALPDGNALYMQTCAACHQADGKGLPGAFPPLAGSPIVNDSNHELFIKIILQGYDARAEYAVMTGFADQLTDEQIAAIANHERSSWGNQAPPLTAEDVKKIRESIAPLN